MMKQKRGNDKKHKNYCAVKRQDKGSNEN